MTDLILRTETETRKFRLLALLAAAVGFYFRQQELPTLALFILIVLYFLYIMLLTPLILPRWRHPSLIYGLIGVDALALGIALALTGVSSSLFIMLPLLVIYYAIYFGYASSLAAAIVFSLSYAGAAFLRGQAHDWGGFMAYQVPLLFLVAIFSGYLSRRRLEERREKEELQELIRLESRAKEFLEVAKSMEQSLSLDTVVGTIVGNAPGLLGFSTCLLGLKENGALVAKGGNVDWHRIARFSEDDPSTAQALSQGKVVFTEAVREGGQLPNWSRELGARSLLVVPLMARGEKIGVLYCLDREQRQPSAELLRTAQSYGEIAGGALASVRWTQERGGKMAELVAELEEAVRRLERLRVTRRQPEVVVGELRIDGVRERVFLANKELNISPTEFDLLYALAENAGQPLNHETLLRRVWGKEKGSANIVDVSIHRLRRKLGEEATPRYIVTVRGKGYMLSPK